MSKSLYGENIEVNLLGNMECASSALQQNPKLFCKIIYKFTYVQLMCKKVLALFLTLLLISYCTSNLLTNLISSTFKIYLESDLFLLSVPSYAYWFKLSSFMYLELKQLPPVLTPIFLLGYEQQPLCFHFCLPQGRLFSIRQQSDPFNTSIQTTLFFFSQTVLIRLPISPWPKPMMWHVTHLSLGLHYSCLLSFPLLCLLLFLHVRQA